MGLKRLGVLVVIGGGLLGGTVLGPTSALAGPPASVSVTLSCDRGVSATAAVDLLSDTGATASGVSDLRCGGLDAPKHVRVVVAGSAASAASIPVFDVVSNSTVSCSNATAQALPLTVDCPVSGAGARLVVR